MGLRVAGFEAGGDVGGVWYWNREPTARAEAAWMDQVHNLARGSLMTRAKTWWVGANVDGKPTGLTMYTGGFAKYREACADAQQDGWRSFAFETARQALTA